MCRLLFVKSKEKFAIPEFLDKFAVVCKNSKEYQGHGWGLAYLKDNKWHHYKNIKPIWEDDFSQFAETNRLIVHARSAFRDKDINVENNMPFYNDKYIYIFNGELNGVKLNVEGRIGAEKIFNFINRFDKGDLKAAVEKGIKIINDRSKYIRAMNIIIADKKKVVITTQFNEDEDYFTMNYKKSEDVLIICSERLDETKWEKVPNNSILEFDE
jgi:glutamine amidotransferase